MRQSSTPVMPTWGWALVLGTSVFFSLGIGFQTGVATAERRAAAALGEMVDVVVALEEIPAGTPVGTRAVVLRSLPKGTVPADPQVFHAVGNVAGRVARERILVNELVRSERVEAPTR